VPRTRLCPHLDPGLEPPAPPEKRVILTDVVEPLPGSVGEGCEDPHRLAQELELFESVELKTEPTRGDRRRQRRERRPPLDDQRAQAGPRGKKGRGCPDYAASDNDEVGCGRKPFDVVDRQCARLSRACQAGFGARGTPSGARRRLDAPRGLELANEFRSKVDTGEPSGHQDIDAAPS
jgi:hypothetical protein